MATIEYARMVLRRAGQQKANREAVVVRRLAKGVREGANPVTKMGSVTGPDFTYTGASGRVWDDDPHQAAYWVCMVDRLLKGNSNWEEAFRTVYVEDGRFHPEERELAQAMAEALGEVEDESALIGGILKEHRLSQMAKQRERQARYAREARERRKLR